MWFIKVIIGLYIITPILYLVCQNDWSMRYYLLLSFLFTGGMNTAKLIIGNQNPIIEFLDGLNINMVVGYSFYFVLGYFLHKVDLNLLMRVAIYVIAIASIIFTCIGTINLSIADTINQVLYANLLPNTMTACTGVFILFKQIFTKQNISIKAKDKILRLSKLSFGIYLMHDFYIIVLEQLGLTKTDISPLIWVPVLSVFGMFLCAAICSIVRRIPILGKWVV